MKFILKVGKTGVEPINLGEPTLFHQKGNFLNITLSSQDQRPTAEIGVVYEWGGIGYLFPKAAVNEDVHCEGDSLTAETAERYIRERKPTLLFIHFSLVDEAGHTKGWGSPAYYTAVHQADSLIGGILQAIKDGGMTDETVVLVTADHGGLKTIHGGKSLQEMEIPWMVCGPGINKGKELDESVMTFDTAATLARLLGLKAPQVWIGRTVTSAFVRH